MGSWLSGRNGTRRDNCRPHVTTMTHCILEVLLNYELELNLVGRNPAGLEENGDDKTDLFQLSKTRRHSGICS